MVNILMNKTVFPELLGRKANSNDIAKNIKKLSLMQNRTKIIDELKRADKHWTRCGHNATELIAKDILTSTTK